MIFMSTNNIGIKDAWDTKRMVPLTVIEYMRHGPPSLRDIALAALAIAYLQNLPFSSFTKTWSDSFVRDHIALLDELPEAVSTMMREVNCFYIHSRRRRDIPSLLDLALNESVNQIRRGLYFLDHYNLDKIPEGFPFSPNFKVLKNLPRELMNKVYKQMDRGIPEPHIEERQLLCLLSHSPQLSKLRLRPYYPLKNILKHLPSTLTYLNLSNCDISDEDLAYINCKTTIQKLQIFSDQRISGENGAFQGWKVLQEIKAKGCVLLEREGLKNLSSS
jgi:hypothetical protein